jgi:hypothetical protein
LLKTDPIFLFELFVLKQNKINIDKQNNVISDNFELPEQNQNSLNNPEIQFHFTSEFKLA